MGIVDGIDEDLVAEHLARASALFAQRCAAVRSRACRLVELAQLDDRLRAHLDSVVAAGDVGRAVIAEGRRLWRPVRPFVLLAVAGQRRDRDQLEDLIARHDDEEHEPGLVSALGWLSPAFVAPIAADWLEYDGPRWRALALAAHLAHRLDPRDAVVRGVGFDGDPRVQREAVRACGVLGFRSLAPTLRMLYHRGSGLLRFLIARALLQLREPDAPALLWECACECRQWSEAAAELAVRHVAPGDARRWIEQIAPLTRLSRVALVAAAATGSPSLARYLLDRLEDPDLASLAAYGLHTMLGLDVDAQGLTLDSGFGPDPELPLPDAAGVRRWWNRARRRFDPNGRWLLGQPLEHQAMRHALWHGPQRLRGLVAHDLHWLLGGVRVPFEVDAPAWRQRRRLAATIGLARPTA